MGGKPFAIPRLITSGTVKVLKIGRPAGLLPKPVMIGHGRVSETERELVNDEGLINLSLLKIQSASLRKIGDLPSA